MAQKIDLNTFVKQVEDEVLYLSSMSIAPAPPPQEAFDDAEKVWLKKKKVCINETKKMLRDLVELGQSVDAWKDEIEQLEQASSELTYTDYYFLNSKIEQKHMLVSEEKAKNIIKKKTVMEKICPALNTVSNDMIEIAKTTTPVIVGLSAAGTITIPLVPVLFASISLYIFRVGISSLCSK